MSHTDHLGTPAWVQAIWEQGQGPQKEDVLFQPARPEQGAYDDWATNARLSLAGDYSYSEGYRLAARIVADRVIRGQGNANFLVYPIFFLYRHNVELQLKRLIPLGASLTSRTLNETELKIIRESHDLKKLWHLFEPILRAATQTLPSITDQDIEGISSYAVQLDEIDHGSFSFRYAETKLGAPSIDQTKLPLIDIRALSQCMEKLTGYLFGLSEMFRDELDIRLEMDVESRSVDADSHFGE